MREERGGRERKEKGEGGDLGLLLGSCIASEGGGEERGDEGEGLLIVREGSKCPVSSWNWSGGWLEVGEREKEGEETKGRETG